MCVNGHLHSHSMCVTKGLDELHELEARRGMCQTSVPKFTEYSFFHFQAVCVSVYILSGLMSVKRRWHLVGPCLMGREEICPSVCVSISCRLSLRRD